MQTVVITKVLSHKMHGIQYNCGSVTMEHLCVTIIIKQHYILVCNNTTVINIMSCRDDAEASRAMMNCAIDLIITLPACNSQFVHKNKKYVYTSIYLLIRETLCQMYFTDSMIA